MSFQGRELTPAELKSLSGASVTYTAEVSLDGKTYTGTAEWPQDETDEAPYTRLTFEPPLPAYLPRLSATLPVVGWANSSESGS